VRKDFDYAFVEDKYRGVPEIRLHEIDGVTPFTVKGVEITPIAGRHSARFNVTGFRIGKLAYMTDFKEIDSSEIEKLKGVEVLVINALRWEPHPSHFSVEEACAIAERVKPRRTILTHLSHEIGHHATSPERLPQGVELGYDGMVIEL
jgi:phosphoribosyl 1,2-cyclic phosphate phosphodiesterase